MKKLLPLIMAVTLLTQGCRSLLPMDSSTPQNKWTSYEEAQAAFEKIVPHVTTVDDLAKLGFDPRHNPNIKVLTYLDVLQRFMHSQTITKADLPEDVLACLEAKDCCKGYELSVESTKNQRYGNIPLDVLGFKKYTHVTGWSFRAILVIQGDVVTYKLSSGEPKKDKFEKKTKPLGPFQELDGMVGKIPGLF
jgi:hypothetical protein